MDDKLTWFIALTGFAVLMQAGILLAMYLAMRKSGERIEALATEVKTKVLPSVEQAQELMTAMRPKLEVIVDNLQDATSVVRSQINRVDSTVNDVVDRTRLQVIRADELMTRTLDRVEQTTDLVQKTVVSPVRQTLRNHAGDHRGSRILVCRARTKEWSSPGRETSRTAR